MRRFLFCCVLWLLFATPPAFAGCSGNPTGNEGDLVYNGTYHVMQYCNGTAWINMGAFSPYGTTNYVAKFTSAYALGNSMLYDSGTGIGIGTTNAINPLTVNGSISIPFGSAMYFGGQTGGGPSITTGYSNTVMIIEGGSSGFQINCQANNCVEVSIANGATSWTSGSDLRLKNVIGTIGSPLEKLSGINGVYFTWKSDSKQARHVGVIAQDVQKVLPEAVGQDGNTDYLGVRYTEMIPLVVEAVKELKSLFDGDHDVLVKLKSDNDSLHAEFEACKAAHP